jgi:hypothetical protein
MPTPQNLQDHDGPGARESPVRLLNAGLRRLFFRPANVGRILRCAASNYCGAVLGSDTSKRVRLRAGDEST